MKITLSVIKEGSGPVWRGVGSAVDAFAHPFWDKVRDNVADKAMEMRRQGFFGAAMLPMSELEYTGIMEKLEMLNTQFSVRG